MIIHNCEQYSEEWWALRAGVPTASRASEIITPTGKPSTQYKALVNSMIAESLGVSSDDKEPTEWMQRGTELEPEARRYYELESGRDVVEVGFITNDKYTGLPVGCSPDGIIDPFTNRGGDPDFKCGFEVKCPKPETHIGYLLAGGLPAYYLPQIHWSMCVSRVTRWVFMSYHPELEPLIVEVEWDDYTEKMDQAMQAFTPKLAEARMRFGL